MRQVQPGHTRHNQLDSARPRHRDDLPFLRRRGKENTTPKYIITRYLEEWLEVEADDEDAALQVSYETPLDEWTWDNLDYTVEPSKES